MMLHRPLVLAAFLVLLVSPTPSAVALPATGQTTCWTTAGAPVPCLDTGQDGDAQAGSPMAYAVRPDGTIRDLVTGLVWETKTNCAGATHCVRDAYTWQGALEYVQGLNAAAFAGHRDWRLPNVKELQSLLNYDRDDPAVSPAFNQCETNNRCTAANLYWSSTTYTEFPDFAFFVNFANGDCYSFQKFLLLNVRAVRRGMP